MLSQLIPSEQGVFPLLSLNSRDVCQTSDTYMGLGGKACETLGNKSLSTCVTSRAEEFGSRETDLQGGKFPEEWEIEQMKPLFLFV